MIITSEPGWVTVQAGTATWASTLPMATGVPSFRPVFFAQKAVSPPAFGPSGKYSSPDLFRDHVLHARMQRAEEIAAREIPAPFTHMPLYPAVQVLRFSSPVSCHTIQSAGLNKAVHGVVNGGSFVHHLQEFGEEPFRGILSAVNANEFLVALAADFVDAIRFRLRGVVLPQLDVGVRSLRYFGRRRAACRPLGGQGLEAVKSVPMPITSSAFTLASFRALGTAFSST